MRCRRRPTHTQVAWKGPPARETTMKMISALIVDMTNVVLAYDF